LRYDNRIRRIWFPTLRMVEKIRPTARAAPIEASQVQELKSQGMPPVDIAKALKIGRGSVYRSLSGGLGILILATATN
jgi:DNA invertase Pin-like site-specific DNA recombinase